DDRHGRGPFSADTGAVDSPFLRSLDSSQEARDDQIVEVRRISVGQVDYRNLPRHDEFRVGQWERSRAIKDAQPMDLPQAGQERPPTDLTVGLPRPHARLDLPSRLLSLEGRVEE